MDNIYMKCKCKNITMFKVNKEDLFEKNMSSQELHQVWVKMKEKQESDKWIDQLEKQYNEVQENKYY